MRTRVGGDLNEARRLLAAGELVAVPTETVYGLAANALDAEAVARVYAAKGRPTFNPLIVHVSDAAAFDLYASEVPEIARRLASAFCPGPLTFVLPKRAVVPDLTTAGGATVALRVPRHPTTLELLRSLPFPLAAPSANLSGGVSPTTSRHVIDGLEGRVAYVLDGGPCDVGVESTVVAFEGERVVVLRPGGVTTEELRRIAGRVDVAVEVDSRSPGTLPSHYAPRIPLVLGDVEALLAERPGSDAAVLVFRRAPKNAPTSADRIALLSAAGDLSEAARNLFGELRRLESSGARWIAAELLPDEGLGFAVNDRLRRAAADREGAPSTSGGTSPALGG